MGNPVMNRPDYSNLSPQEQIIVNELAELQQQQMMEFVNNTTQVCFDACVRYFHTTELDSKEANCLNNCVQKYIMYSARIDKTFQQFMKSVYEKQMADAPAPNFSSPQQDSSTMGD